MRFSRDRRGYENTFVLHGERRRGKGRPRLLYWFRTPPEVKVGRAALDEEAIRLIEELNPDIEFDWTRILKGEGHPEEFRGAERRGADRPREGRRPDEGRQRSRGQSQKGRQQAPAAAQPERAPAPEVDGTPLAADAAAAPAAETTGFSAPPPTPAHARLGGEGVARLRGRYAEIMTRIAERLTDEAQREELKTLAERLNPDTWVTDDEVRSGLEGYEGVFASLRTAVGTRKRRRRRRGRPGAGTPQTEAPATPVDEGSLAEPDVERSKNDDDAEDL